jgi:hypothetical protein
LNVDTAASYIHPNVAVPGAAVRNSTCGPRIDNAKLGPKKKEELNGLKG